MTKIVPLLIILCDPSREAMYAHLARQAGVPLIQAEGALHALTQLERSEVGAIICDAQLEEMSGEEFRSVVQQGDAKSKDLPIFLIANTDDLADSISDADTLGGPQILAQAFKELGIDSSDHPIPVNQTMAPHLEGDLRIMSLSEFLVWIAELKYNGHWLVSIESALGSWRQGHIAMLGGKIIYAEYLGLSGKKAMLNLMKDVKDQPKTVFKFFKFTEGVVPQNKEFDKTTERLLIELSVELDNILSQQAGSEN